VLATSDALQPEDIRLDFAPGALRPPRTAAAALESFLAEGTTLEEHERQLIREALKRANGNKSQAARLLGLTRKRLALTG